MTERQKQIVNIWVTLPVKERLELYKLLGTGVAEDADRYSSGRPESLIGYDLVINGPKPQQVHDEGKVMTTASHASAEVKPSPNENKPE